MKNLSVNPLLNILKEQKEMRLKKWDNERGYLLDTCRAAQDKYRAILEYFELL